MCFKPETTGPCEFGIINAFHFTRNLDNSNINTYPVLHKVTSFRSSFKFGLPCCIRLNTGCCSTAGGQSSPNLHGLDRYSRTTRKSGRLESHSCIKTLGSLQVMCLKYLYNNNHTNVQLSDNLLQIDMINGKCNTRNI